MYSLVIPVYKNEGSIPDLLQALEQMQAQLDARLEVVFVVDGSPDRCYSLLKQGLPQVSFASQLLLHSRNYGSVAGVRTGLQVATGEYISVMAADLQEPPELIIEIFNTLKTDECDVIIGIRDSRADPLLSRIASRIFWGIYRRFVISDIPEGGVDIFGCNRQVCDELLNLQESHSSHIGLLFWLGFRRKSVSYRRLPRQHGKSAWTFRKKIDYLMDSVFSFSDLPIKVLITAGGIGLMFSLLFSLLILGVRLASEIPVPGYTATVITILFFGGLNMLGLGIIGAYVWRAYNNTQSRPLSVVMRTHVFPGRPLDSIETQNVEQQTLQR